MLFSEQDVFVLFTKKVRCALSRMRARGMEVSTTSYGLYNIDGKRELFSRHIVHNGLAVLNLGLPTKKAHPLSIFLEGKPHRKTTVRALSNFFRCNKGYIIGFNLGLKGGGQGRTHRLWIADRMYQSYYDFGTNIRRELGL